MSLRRLGRGSRDGGLRSVAGGAPGCRAPEEPHAINGNGGVAEIRSIADELLRCLRANVLQVKIMVPSNDNFVRTWQRGQPFIEGAVLLLGAGMGELAALEHNVAAVHKHIAGRTRGQMVARVRVAHAHNAHVLRRTWGQVFVPEKLLCAAAIRDKEHGRVVSFAPKVERVRKRVNNVHYSSNPGRKASLLGVGSFRATLAARLLDLRWKASGKICRLLDLDTVGPSWTVV